MYCCGVLVGVCMYHCGVLVGVCMYNCDVLAGGVYVSLLCACKCLYVSL